MTALRTKAGRAEHGRLHRMDGERCPGFVDCKYQTGLTAIEREAAVNAESLAAALHGFVQVEPTSPHSQVRPRIDDHICWPCWNGADYILASIALSERGTPL